MKIRKIEYPGDDSEYALVSLQEFRCQMTNKPINRFVVRPVRR